MERWVERSRTNLEHLAGDLLDSEREAPAVHAVERQGLQDQKIQRPL